MGKKNWTESLTFEENDPPFTTVRFADEISEIWKLFFIPNN